jgi:glycyl-tRNA synthetase beta chain
MSLNKTSFTFEIGIEELPSRLIQSTCNYFKESLGKLFANQDIEHKEPLEFCSARRILLYYPEISTKASDRVDEIKGPPLKIAWLEDKNEYTKAATGFASKNEASESDLIQKDNYVWLKKEVKGLSLVEILEGNLTEIFYSVTGKRFMRWQNSKLKFSRPLEWLAILVGDQTINLRIENIKNDKYSYGKRLYGKKQFDITNLDSYFKDLEKEHIIIEPTKRAAKITFQVTEIADKENLIADLDSDLLAEINGLVESPQAILCSFDEKYLEIPALVLSTVMKSHQRYIPLYQDQGKKNISNKFIVISDNPEAQAIENIRSGNEKVIIPRFEDALFFIKEDFKVSLEKRYLKLDKINFQIGNLLDKAKRLELISDILTTELNSHPQKSAQIEALQVKQASKLCKTDLSTSLVFEFTELQGELGGIYASRQGQTAAVAQAISEHYQPRFAGDSLPCSPAGKVLAIADKLDNILSSFALGKIPKGSADPFALRRQANGILEILIHSELVLNLRQVISEIIKNCAIYSAQGNFSNEELLNKCLEFLEQRLEFVFSIYHTDSINNKAALDRPDNLVNLNHSHKMIHLLNQFKQDSNFEEALNELTRVINISKNFVGLHKTQPIKSELFEKEIENKLYQEILELNRKITVSYQPDPGFSYQDLVQITPTIRDFFEEVLINHEDEQIKANRQVLISLAREVFTRVANFSKLKTLISEIEVVKSV